MKRFIRLAPIVSELGFYHLRIPFTSWNTNNKDIDLLTSRLATSRQWH